MSSVFFSYSHKDEDLRNRLETGLSMLKRQRVITTWHDRRLLGGSDIDMGISEYLNKSDIILLLVSPDFLASDYCYGKEMTRALERHEAGTARVIPIILRPCDWKNAPFSNLLAAPTDGKPVTKWPDQDDAFLEITNAIRRAAESGTKIQASQATSAVGRSRAEIASEEAHKRTSAEASRPRSSNLRLGKSFTDHDRDVFRDESFEYIAKYFENSLDELKTRNPGNETTFRRIDANNFTASVYRNGEALSRCQIRLSFDFVKGITFSHGTTGGNGFNESLSVETDEQSLYLKPMGMAMMGSTKEHLSQEGASEYYWSLFIEPLQHESNRRRR